MVDNNILAVKDISVVFVGAGNLATNLAKAMFRSGFRIQQVYSRTEESARKLAEEVEAEWTVDLQKLIQSHQVMYIVSLKDAAFIELLPQITRGKEDALWMHTAGSIAMDVWKPYVKRYGVLYPLQTFSKQQEVDFRMIPFFVEASSHDELEALKGVAAVLSDKVVVADSVQRGNIHLAAVFACNFVNHLYALSAKLLEKHQLPFDVLLPLIDETARKVHTLNPVQAQTGPAIRYDENIINKHLEMLADDSSLQDIYQMLTKSIYRCQSNLKEIE